MNSIRSETVKMVSSPGHLSATLLRGLCQMASPAGRRARLAVLMYHRVLSEPDGLFPETEDVGKFTWHMETVARFFNVLPLSEGINRLREGTLPPRALCITFDDGYADNYQVALPILKQFGLPATFFIATAYLGGGRMWNDSVIESIRNAPGTTVDLTPIGLARYEVGEPAQRRMAAMNVINALKYKPFDARLQLVEQLSELVGTALPDDLMMTQDEVRGLRRAGMEIGAHTRRHPILARLELDRAREEIVAGKQQLEEIVGERVELFAYPNGKPNHDYHQDHVRCVRDAGFIGAVSTAWGASRLGSDLYQLPRFTPWDATPTQFVLRLLRNYWYATESAV